MAVGYMTSILALLGAALVSTACGADDTTTTSTPAPTPSPTASPIATTEFTKISLLVAEFEAKTAEEQEAFCAPVYADGYTSAAGRVAEEGTYEQGETYRVLTDLCPNRVTFQVRCEDASVDWEQSFTIARNSPDFSDAWATTLPDGVMCSVVDEDSLLSSPPDITETVTDAESVLQERGGSEAVLSAYALCTVHGTDVSKLGAESLEGARALCPTHPDAEQRDRRAQELQAEADVLAAEAEQVEQGLRFGNGLYRVGEDIQPGTYIAESESGFAGCYWERQDVNGDVIDNNFVRSFQTQVTIASSDSAFLTEGCGQWRPL